MTNNQESEVSKEIERRGGGRGKYTVKSTDKN